MEKTVKDLFVYSVDPFNIAPKETWNNRIVINSDSDFELQHIVCSAINKEFDTDILTSLPLLLQIRDIGSGRYLFNKDTQMATLTKYRLPQPHLFYAKSFISLVFYNPTQYTFTSVYFTMLGSKVFSL